MGWSDCGTDDLGRPIGYGFAATCDHPECEKKIDRGLAYVCGGMHGCEPVYNAQGEFINTCGRYFCEDHRIWVDAYDDGGKEKCFEVCAACVKEIAEHLGEMEHEDEVLYAEGSYEGPDENGTTPPG